MEDNKERLLKDFEGRLLPHFTPEDVDTITRCMMMTLAEFRVEKEPNVHPHRFRHTMASNLAERGMQVHEIQQILGHSNVNTTMRYVHTSRAAIQSSFRKYSG